MEAVVELQMRTARLQSKLVRIAFAVFLRDEIC